MLSAPPEMPGALTFRNPKMVNSLWAFAHGANTIFNSFFLFALVKIRDREWDTVKRFLL